MNKQKILRLLMILVGAGLAVFILIQLVPYGKTHSNPPVTGEPKWDSPQTRAMVKRACFDCHSNETVYPWYASIAPSSWLLQFDIDRARANMNFSEWSAGIDGTIMANDIEKVLRRDEMPPIQYRLIHPEARLSDAEKTALINGLRASLAKK